MSKFTRDIVKEYSTGKKVYKKKTKRNMPVSV